MGGAGLKTYLRFLASDEIFDAAIKKQLIRPLLEMTVETNPLLIKGVNIQVLISILKEGHPADTDDGKMAARLEKLVKIGYAMSNRQDILWDKGSNLDYLDPEITQVNDLVKAFEATSI